MDATRSVILIATLANVLGGASAAWAQQKYTITSTPNSNAQVLQEHIIEVDDVPEHRLRLYEIRQDYPQRDLAFAGVVVKYGLSRNISDAISGNGSFTYYMVYTLEDGNKVFARGTGTTQSDPAAGYRFAIVENFVGGTGKFKGLRGQARGGGTRAPGASALAVEWKGEYWVDD